MTREQSLTKRRELVESGYTIVPGVMDKDLLDRLRTWSDRIFERVTVPHKIRYQGSDIFGGRTCFRTAYSCVPEGADRLSDKPIQVEFQILDH